MLLSLIDSSLLNSQPRTNRIVIHTFLLFEAVWLDLSHLFEFVEFLTPCRIDLCSSLCFSLCWEVVTPPVQASVSPRDNHCRKCFDWCPSKLIHGVRILFVISISNGAILDILIVQYETRCIGILRRDFLCLRRVDWIFYTWIFSPY